MTRPRGRASRAAAMAAARSSMSRRSMAFTRSSGRSMTMRATPAASAGTNVTEGRAAERDGDRVRGCDEQLVRGVEGGVGVAPNRREGLEPERLRTSLAGEDDSRGAVGQRACVARGDRSVLAIEARPERGEPLQA